MEKSTALKHCIFTTWSSKPCVLLACNDDFQQEAVPVLSKRARMSRISWIPKWHPSGEPCVERADFLQCLRSWLCASREPLVETSLFAKDPVSLGSWVLAPLGRPGPSLPDPKPSVVQPYPGLPSPSLPELKAPGNAAKITPCPALACPSPTPSCQALGNPALTLQNLTRQ